jgi:hypothetical protein
MEDLRKEVEIEKDNYGSFQDGHSFASHRIVGASHLFSQLEKAKKRGRCKVLKLAILLTFEQISRDQGTLCPNLVPLFVPKGVSKTVLIVREQVNGVRCGVNNHRT